MYEELIGKLEAAKEADRELDCEIAIAVLGGEIEWKMANYTMDSYPVRRYDSSMHIGGRAGEPVERYTASLDAAMSLIPEDRRWQMRAWWPNRLSPLVYSCEVFTEADGSVGRSGCAWAAPTPAIALCIAALKARS